MRMRSLCAFLLLIATLRAADFPLIEPKDAAAALSSASKPLVLYVGPNVLYRNKHIPGAIYAGMAARSDGIELLKKAVAGIAKDRPIILYCGCCPWSHCPNVRPAVEAMQAMGFTHVRVMHLPNDFKTDWIDKGYPAE
jgi:3-mercaptopyruvate sulfurtransferase SseA